MRHTRISQQLNHWTSISTAFLLLLAVTGCSAQSRITVNDWNGGTRHVEGKILRTEDAHLIVKGKDGEVLIDRADIVEIDYPGDGFMIVGASVAAIGVGMLVAQDLGDDPRQRRQPKAFITEFFVFGVACHYTEKCNDGGGSSESRDPDPPYVQEEEGSPIPVMLIVSGLTMIGLGGLENLTSRMAVGEAIPAWTPPFLPDDGLDDER